MNAAQLKESFADIEALAHRVSWELMDEDQRDEFMVKIVVPRWGKTTSDGVVLKGTAWASMVGATEETVRNRFRRLTARSEPQGERSRSLPAPNQQASIRSAKAALREHPELAARLVEDPDVRRAVTRATDDHYRRQAADRSQRTDQKTNADPVSRQMNARKAINDLGEVCERFSRDGNEALRRVGELPESERYWLTGAVDRAEATLRATRRYLDLGRSEIDAEITALLNGA